MQGPETGKPARAPSGPPTPERWQRIKELFEAASELPAAEREAYLDAAAAGDPALRARVEAMLAAESDGEAFLEGSVAELAAGLLERRRSLVGRRVGAHRVVREIGGGGMGAVYLAEREDEQYQERVAIKVVREGLGGGLEAERFRQERQILASLDHPHIARMLDGGVTEEGLPYFVMEHIEGEPLDAFCDARRLGVAERLRLFLAVCEAVGYAHRNLVVHRDLKYGNILVNAEGVPKLLDFGIAKLLDPGRPGAAVDVTRTGMRPLTPQTASPEQVLGQAITTASDVYSLGVVLYQLLTGRPPYRLYGLDLRGMEETICEREPVRASEAVREGGGEQVLELARRRGATPERLARALRGDLDNVLAKALRKVPERRYGSVEAFAEDVRRYLTGLPVAARPDTIRYRTGKFVSRHRVGVLASAVVLLSLVAGIVGTSWQARVARRESERAAEVSSYLLQVMAELDPDESGSSEVPVRALLDESAALIDELEGQPELQAKLMGRIGLTYFRLGAAEEAEALIERALAVRRRAFGAEHVSVAASLNNLGVVKGRMGEHAAARSLLEEALAMRRHLLGTEHPQVADSLEDLTVFLTAQGEHGAAEPLAREALALQRRLHGPRHETVAAALNNLGSVLFQLGRAEEAEPLLLESLALYRETRGERFPQVAKALHNLAGIALGQGRPEEAAERYGHALEIFRRVGEQDEGEADCLYGLAVVHHLAGEREEAEPLYREALEIYRGLWGEEREEVALVCLALGRLRLDAGDLDEAESLLRLSLSIREKVLSAGHWKTALTRSELGGCLLAHGALDEARALLEASHPLLLRTFGPEHRYTVRAAQRLAALRAHAVPAGSTRE